MGFLRYNKVTVIPGVFQVNIGPLELAGGTINVMKNFQSQKFYNGTSPTNLDADGYPISLLNANLGGSVVMPAAFAPNSTIFVLKMSPGSTRHIQLVINAPVTLNTTVPGMGGSASSGSIAISGGSNSNLTATFTGAGKVYFNFIGYASSGLSFFFPSGYANTAGTGDLALVRQSDEAAYDMGSYFTPELIALLTDLGPTTIRTMGWSHNSGQGSNHVQYRYRTSTTTLSWLNAQFPPRVWGGTAVTSDNIAYTCGDATHPPDSNPGAYVGGEVIQLKWPNAANANASPTLNRNSLGARPIVGEDGLPLFAGSIPPNALATFVYDSLLGKFLCTAGFSTGAGNLDVGDGGLTWSVPVEAHVQLANTLNKNLWYVVPNWADDIYVSSVATYIRDNLNSTLTAYFEYSNEIWNTAAGFTQTNWAYRRGLAFGFPDANNEPYHGWYGLRVRQIMGAITTLWTATGRPLTTLKRVMGSFAITDQISNAQNYRLNGSDLNGTTYPNYLAYVGGTDPGYNSSPNRPIDYCDVVAYAPYFQGANFADLDPHYQAGSAAVLQTAANNYVSGGAGIATALAWLDGDIRTGMLGGTVGDKTLLGMSQAGGVYPLYEALAHSYDSSRATHLTVECYEGALQCQPPSTFCAKNTLNIAAVHTITLNTTSGPGTQAVNWTGHTLQNGDRISFHTTLTLPPEISYSADSVDFFVMNSAANKFDISPTYFNRSAITPSSAGTGTITAWASSGLDNLLNAYKNDPAYGRNIAFDYFDQFRNVSSFPHSKAPSWLQICGPNSWSLLPGDIFSTPYQTYYGVKAFH